jgi:hypothetical protein
MKVKRSLLIFSFPFLLSYVHDLSDFLNCEGHDLSTISDFQLVRVNNTEEHYCEPSTILFTVP